MRLKLMTLLAVCAALSGCVDYSDGVRVGTLQKFSRKGVFCKTWDGEMMLGGLRRRQQGGGEDSPSVTTYAPNLFEFTVEDEKLIARVQDLADRSAVVRVKYRQELVTFCRTHSSGNYFVTSIEEVKP